MDKSTSKASPYQSFVFQRRFFPLFWVQFLGAFNDNVFKSALVMLITFRLAETPQQAGLYITLAAGIFILPFFLFSALAGQLADKVEKSRLIRQIKLAEILIMVLGAAALMAEDVRLLMAVLFLMGLQSTFFGPIKYALLPEHLKEDELLHGNGWFSASTFVAILLGTVLGGWLVLVENGIQWMGYAVLAVALLGYVASRSVPPGVEGEAALKLQWNVFKGTWQEMGKSRHHRQAFFAVLAISWFWFLGATYLSQIPVLVKEWLFADEQVVLLFLSAFSVGIGLGAWVVSLLKTQVRDLEQIRWQAWLLLGMSVAMLLSNVALNQITPSASLQTLAQWWPQAFPLLVLLLLAVVALLGGMFIVPLYTLLQVKTPLHERSRMVAVNNITNALFMVASSLLVMALYAFGWDLVDILYSVAMLNLGAAAWYFRRSRTLSEEGK